MDNFGGDPIFKQFRPGEGLAGDYAHTSEGFAPEEFPRLLPPSRGEQAFTIGEGLTESAQWLKNRLKDATEAVPGGFLKVTDNAVNEFLNELLDRIKSWSSCKISTRKMVDDAVSASASAFDTNAAVAALRSLADEIDANKKVITGDQRRKLREFLNNLTAFLKYPPIYPDPGSDSTGAKAEAIRGGTGAKSYGVIPRAPSASKVIMVQHDTETAQRIAGLGGPPPRFAVQFGQQTGLYGTLPQFREAVRQAVQAIPGNAVTVEMRFDPDIPPGEEQVILSWIEGSPIEIGPRRQMQWLALFRVLLPNPNPYPGYFRPRTVREAM